MDWVPIHGTRTVVARREMSEIQRSIGLERLVRFFRVHGSEEKSWIRSLVPRGGGEFHQELERIRSGFDLSHPHYKIGMDSPKKRRRRSQKRQPRKNKKERKKKKQQRPVAPPLAEASACASASFMVRSI
ncbi:hypothetical protein B296_00003682 [Ensete ventricosum]|uniref:Uncharacterized protein n=1 Tax=Ensete ventricosum TaxID=4639 RepID=A0A426YLX8_ENSVE|nr:hypothetical protein B296_00003682 [Ensete ventricosum]